MNTWFNDEGRADERSVPASRAALIGLGEIVLHVLAGLVILGVGVGLAWVFA